MAAGESPSWAPGRRKDKSPQDTAASDGYGTGFVVFIARRAGVPASDPRLARGVAWLKTHQTRQRPLVHAFALLRQVALHHQRRHVVRIDGGSASVVLPADGGRQAVNGAPRTRAAPRSNAPIKTAARSTRDRAAGVDQTFTLNPRSEEDTFRLGDD